MKMMKKKFSDMDPLAMFLIGTIILLVIILAIAVTCMVDEINRNTELRLMSDENGVSFSYVGRVNDSYIVRHDTTGVCYIIGDDGTVMLVNADGTPYTTES